FIWGYSCGAWVDGIAAPPTIPPTYSKHLPIRSASFGNLENCLLYDSLSSKKLALCCSSFD
ncbi:MAG: hypothetical protein PQJ28_01750, partial [Spirochaetales bacterium]|nr:hypothetical protein [Spirochaetales bacterium]